MGNTNGKKMLQMWDEASGSYVDTLPVKYSYKNAESKRRHLTEAADSSVEQTAASAGETVVELRKLPTCETYTLYFFWCMVSVGPLALTFLSVMLTGSALHPWVRDFRKEGYLKTFT